MALDRLASRQHHVELLERYGRLLTEHQREVLALYLRDDWSLSEIAARQETSRAAVHDLIRRATASLEDLEDRLGLLAARQDLGREVRSLRHRLDALERLVERV
ncbi:MAG: sigma factor-like helix-turn-helix DNA-binding protein [Candidatus Dormibacteraceae bacterium]